MWDYLKKVYNQDHIAKCFQLEYEIGNYTLGDLFIQDYIYGFQNLWDKFVDIIYDKIPVESFAVV